MIKVTDAAEKYLADLANAENKIPTLAITGGGCAGFQYDWSMSAEDVLDPTEYEIIELNSGSKLAIDGMSIMYLYGSVIDYKTSIAGSALEIENPSANSGCGCGVSVGFDMDMVDNNMMYMDDTMFNDAGDN